MSIFVCTYVYINSELIAYFDLLSRRISSIKVDDGTVSTFELYLTLKQDQSGWASILPQFLK